MKTYVSSYNGVLDEYKAQVEFASPLDADKIVMWQDCAGSWAQLAKHCKRFFPKPIYVMQHGRRASRDYDKPLSKPFLGDTFLAWGHWDQQNMTRLGHDSIITGCPLNSWIKPKVAHKEKVILFVPVNTGKEEPDNIRAYNELLKIKLDVINCNLTAKYDDYRGAWSGLTRNQLADNFTVITKVLPWHDHKMYTEGIVKGNQDSARNNKLIFDLLRNVDVVVGLDEGTTELFALAHDVPVIVVDGFQYRWVEGRTEVPRTPGIVHVPLAGLRGAVEDALAHPEKLQYERQQTAENEMSILTIKDPIKRLHEIIGS
jgi:hypothetical protein